MTPKSGIQASLSRARRRSLLPSVLAAGLALAAAGPAAAQVVISSQPRNAGVAINQDVLDALGPPTNRQILDPMTSRRGVTGARPTADGAPRSRLYGVAPTRSAYAEPPRSALVETPRSGLTQPMAAAAAPSPRAAMPVRDTQGATHLAPLSQPSGDWMLTQQQMATASPPMAQAPRPSPLPSASPAPAPTPAPAPIPMASAAPMASAVPQPPSNPNISPITNVPPPLDRSTMAAAPPPPLPSERTAARGRQPSPPPTPAALDPVPAPRSAPLAPIATPPAAPIAPVSSSPAASMPAASMPAPPRPAPATVAAAPATSAPVQTAVAGGTLSRVLFSAGSADLSDGARRDLAQLADKLGRDGESRIQLLAYAEGTADNESQARRLSLSRALAVRSYLIDQGIRSTRVNVQALGIKSAGGPADRVDAMAAAP